jgi:hypothetical protein
MSSLVGIEEHGTHRRRIESAHLGGVVEREPATIPGLDPTPGVLNLGRRGYHSATENL